MDIRHSAMVNRPLQLKRETKPSGLGKWQDFWWGEKAKTPRIARISPILINILICGIRAIRGVFSFSPRN
jgi:hypothetical protein